MDFKNFEFSCPFCAEKLNNKGVVGLKTVRSNGERGEIFLSVAIGDYSYRHVPEVNFEKGEIVDFLCPNCENNLEAPNYDNFALLRMNVDQNIVFEVIFSREAGKRKTYVITEDGIETYHG